MTVEIRVELEKLPSEALDVLRSAMHDLANGGLKDLILEILWDRHATPGGGWLRRCAAVGDPLDRDKLYDLPQHQLIGYCGAGDAPSGQDEHVRHDRRHVVRRTMSFSSGGADYGGLECSCGRRSDRPDGAKDWLNIRWYKLNPDPGVWPKVSDPSRNNGYPAYQVCRDAPTADHQAHAPNSLGDRCLCGRAIGEYYDSESDDDVCRDKFLPVQ